MYPHEHPSRSTGPLLLRAVQRRRLRHRLSPRCPGAALWSRHRAVPARPGGRASPCPACQSAASAGLCPERARFHDHDVPARDRRTGKLAPFPRRALDAGRFHRLFDRRRDRRRSRRTQRPMFTNRGPRQASAVFALDPATGAPAPRQWVPTKGSVPRFFFAFDQARALSLHREPGAGHSIVAYKVGRDGKIVTDLLQAAKSAAQPASFSAAEYPHERQELRFRDPVGACRRRARSRHGARAGRCRSTRTTAYVFEDADPRRQPCSTYRTVGFIYSRLTNPTNAALETRLATLEGGRGCTVAASGHAAQVLALFSADEARATRSSPLRAFTAARCKQMRKHLSEVRPGRRTSSNADQPDNFKRAVTPKTKAFFIESLANPGGVISDIEAIARIAEERRAVPPRRRQHARHPLALQAGRLRRDGWSSTRPPSF